jgi:murein DD-endopeptidase MepM/ murein hydrolase activator NlpD
MRALVLLGGVLAALVAAPLAAKDADPKSETEHVVKPGETLGGIAVRAEVPRILIIEANGLKQPFTVRAGQSLIIPRRRSHEVKPGETGFGIALEYGVAWSVIAVANGIDPKAPLRTGQKLAIPTVSKAPAEASLEAGPSATPSPSPSPSPAADAPPAQLAWPVQGSIRRGFAPRGKRNFHDGIDITAEDGTAVRASAAGRVIYAEAGPREYGNTVIVHHGERWTTTYAQLSRITVKNGERVKAGERVGLVGHSGIARDDQLHFEVRHNREALDPEKILPQRSVDQPKDRIKP